MSPLTLSGQTYEYHDNIAQNTAWRTSFNALSQQTFGLDFEPWYQQGYWQDDYHPHVFIHDHQVVANVSFNRIPTEYQGVAKTYGQIGTVMTHPEHRHRGLADALMQQVLTRWLPQCDALYLYANASVLAFYPRYGFVPAQTHQHQRRLSPRPSPCLALNMNQAPDVARLRRYFAYGNGYAELPLRGNWGLLMFYCSQHLAQCVFYLPEFDVVAIVAEEDDHTLLYDVYGAAKAPLDVIMAALAKSAQRPVALGFTPKNDNGFEVVVPPADDAYLFVHQDKDHPFAERALTLPALAKA
ncbi:MAG: GNAT family N-acetyltransferase [Neisseriaceae bacterium]|nr:GNAT family N-acetyltransferase [Neisseriaceae bacterium]